MGKIGKDLRESLLVDLGNKIETKESMNHTYNIIVKRNIGKITKGLKIQISHPHSPSSKIIIEAYERQFGVKGGTASLRDFIIEKVKLNSHSGKIII